MALFSTLKKRWQCFQRRSAWKHTLPSNQFRSSPDRPEFASTLQLIQLVPAVRHLARFLAGSFPFAGVSFMWFALRSWTQLPRAQAFAQMPWRATRIGIRSALLCAEESRGIHDARCSSCCWLRSIVSDGSNSSSAIRGYVVIKASSLKQAVDHFHAGDFDLVMLCHSVPATDRERLTSLIRASGSRIPIVSIAGSLGECDAFANATLEDGPNRFLAGIRDALIKAARTPAA